MTQETATEAEKKTLPGDTTLPSSANELANIAQLETHTFKFSVEDFFRKPQQSQFSLSPDGKHIAFRKRNEEGRQPLVVKNIKDGSTREVVKENDGLISSYFWKDNNRILFTKDHEGNENYHLFITDIEKGEVRNLTPIEQVTIQSVEKLSEDPDHVAVTINSDNPQLFFPYRININTGERTPLLDASQAGSTNVNDITCDAKGVLRVYTILEGNETYVYYRSSAQEDFKKVITTDWKKEFNVKGLDKKNDNPDVGYVYTNFWNNTSCLVRYNFRTQEKTEVVHADPGYDLYASYQGPVLNFSKKRGGELDSLEYYNATHNVVPLTDWYKDVHEKIQRHFESLEYSVVSRDSQDKHLLLRVFSGNSPSVYYQYDAEEDTVSKLASVADHLLPEEMGTVTPIRFASRDGLTLQGYICRPKNTDGPTPLIVNPHGGPYGIRDVYEFNPEMQLFASRGYATLQVNYRGSGGYGETLWKAGFNQVGRKMLDDLEDGVAYVIEQGWAHKDKLAIYGASYGGLATLGSLVKTPDLYTCGVNYVGVSNLFTFYKSIPPYWKPMLEMLFEQWYNPEDEEHKKIMTAASPALNAEAISKPLLVVQGANDPRVNIDESDQIVTGLRNRGFDVPYMVKYDEGHGFAKEENRLELYKIMIGFLAKHLKE